MLCIAVKEAFHTLQEELKKEKKTLCLVDVRYVNQSRVFEQRGWKGSMIFSSKSVLGAFAPVHWILLNEKTRARQKAVVPTAIIGDPQ